jgi:hypothetical protein
LNQTTTFDLINVTKISTLDSRDEMIDSAFFRQLVTCFRLLAFQEKNTAKHARIARQWLAVRPRSKARANKLYIFPQ